MLDAADSQRGLQLRKASSPPTPDSCLPPAPNRIIGILCHEVLASAEAPYTVCTVQAKVKYEDWALEGDRVMPGSSD